MALSRRALLAAAAATATRLAAQPKVRTGPLICLNSRLLPGIYYADMPPILSGLGFDGCDLAVQPDGTVRPDQLSVDLVRAIESMQGRHLEVPIITTNFITPVEPWARSVIYIAGGSHVPLLRPGYWRYPTVRLEEMEGQIAGLAAVCRSYNMVMGLPNTGGAAVLRKLDPAWVGYDFDPSQATADLPVEAAVSRIKMVILRDAKLQNGKRTPCPLGQGTVDWPKFFDALAHAKYSGPLTLQVDYPVTDMLEAIKRDLDFARKQLNTAYQKVIDSTSHPPSAAPLV